MLQDQCVATMIHESLMNQYFQSGVMARLGIEMLAISEMTEFLVSPGPANIKKQGAVIKAEVEKICSFLGESFVSFDLL